MMNIFLKVISIKITKISNGRSAHLITVNFSTMLIKRLLYNKTKLLKKECVLPLLSGVFLLDGGEKSLSTYKKSLH